MRKLAPALAVVLAGCWQVAVVGDQLTSGGNGSTSAKPTSGSTGTGGRSTSGSGTGRSSSGSSSGTGRSDVCGPCAPGATCDGGVCVCPGVTDGTTCPNDSSQGLFCIEGTCAPCGTHGGTLHGDQCLIELAFNDNSPTCLAVDSTSVYWTDAQGIWKASIRDVRKKVPDTAQELLYGISNASCLAIDAYYVYFTDADGEVREVPLDGGEVITVASLQLEPYAIAVDRENIYWTSYSGNKVMRLKKTAAPVEPDVIADVIDGGNPFGIAINDSSVFWTNRNDGEVLMVSLDGGDPMIIASGQGQPYWIAVNDAGGVYWTNNGTGEVVRQPLAGPFDGGILLARGQEGPTGIAVDSDFVYWTNNSCTANCVLRAPLDGGPPELVFPGEGALTQDAYRIAVDPENVYWTIDDALSGRVYELTPK